MSFWESVKAANGEARIQGVRYGCGWYCLIVTYDVDDLGVWEKWEDLVSGDNDYLAARKFFEAPPFGGIFLAVGPDPESAITAAVKKATG